MTGRILLVGESNPYNDDPGYALYPFPVGASGDRLCRVILGMEWREYLEAFDRVDLVTGPWRIRDARRAAGLLTHRRRILLGTKVAAAHGFAFKPFSAWTTNDVRGGIINLFVWPHPSGRCRLWTPEAIERARAQVKELEAL